MGNHFSAKKYMKTVFKYIDGRKLTFQNFIHIHDALKKFNSPKIPCSFDMLGEAARTQSDVDFFFDAYENAIRKVGEKNALLSSSFHEISIYDFKFHMFILWNI